MGALVVIGCDVGQKSDPSALAVSECEARALVEPRAFQVGDVTIREERTRTVEHYVIRHLERLPLGTPYPAVVARLRSVAQGVRERTGRRPWLFIDATGVGQPIIDMARERRVDAVLRAVYFNHGIKRIAHENGEITLGKAHLVSRLQALLQTQRLHLPHTAEAAALARELETYEIRVDEDSTDRYGAFKTGAHDDLVTALGLSTQAVPIVRAY